MEFPRRDADLIVLVQKLIVGMAENPDYPSPPLSTSDLRNMLDAFIAASDAQLATQSAEQQATEIKHDKRNVLIGGARAMIDYAVNAVHGNDAKLTALGWSARAPRTPHVIELPGQPRNVRVAEQGEGSLTLVWEEPSDGDAPLSYKAEYRVLDGETVSSWRVADASVHTELALTEQERGKTLEYRVIAINKAGSSLPSNTVTVVL